MRESKILLEIIRQPNGDSAQYRIIKIQGDPIVQVYVSPNQYVDARVGDRITEKQAEELAMRKNIQLTTVCPK
jgi:hypothetical protein